MTTTERPGANDPGVPDLSSPWFDATGMTPDEFAEAAVRHSAARATARMKREEAAALTEAQTNSPIMALFRRYQELTDAAEAYTPPDPDGDIDEDLERLFYRERDCLGDAMMTLPARTAQDMAAKMIVAHCHGQHSCLCYDTEPVWLEARALVGSNVKGVPVDRLPELVHQWKAAVTEFCAAVHEPGGENFESPECLRWIAARDDIEEQIKETPVTTHAGAAALIEFAWEDYGFTEGEWLELPRWLIDKLHSWHQDRAMIGGAA